MKIKHYALIPAKEKSSRCSNKNWRPFIADKNLVTYLLSIIPDNFFDLILLSTDKNNVDSTDKIMVHRRDKSLATVESPINDLISVIINTYKLQDNSYIWLLNPTSPFRNKDDFIKIKEIIEHKKSKSVISVSKIHPFIWQDDLPLFETCYPRKNTQDVIIEKYIENGQFIVFQISEFKHAKTWYTDKTFLYKQNNLDSFFDIDTENDFLEAQKWANTKIYPETMKNETLRIERLIKSPIEQNIKIIYDHFGRYASAVQMLNISNKDVVIDASCGLGYGSYILSFKAKKVIGLDINKEYINKAKQIFNSEKICLYCYDEYENLLGMNENQKADKIVCIETFEHISKLKIEFFIKKLLHSMKKGGDMFVTVPLGKNQPSSYNKFHLNEPSIDILYNLFAKFFDRITFEIETFVNSYGHREKSCLILLKSFVGE